jgi:methylthioribose-1-phosphate isomerase
MNQNTKYGLSIEELIANAKNIHKLAPTAHELNNALMRMSLALKRAGMKTANFKQKAQ